MRICQVGMEKCTYLKLTKASFICKFPCLLNQPPTSLQWSASFFDISLTPGTGPSMKTKRDREKGINTSVSAA